MAPPEDGLHPPHGRHAAVVPEHVAELRVDPSLHGVVGARQRALRGEPGAKVGEMGKKEVSTCVDTSKPDTLFVL